jgi:hypothetical protein
MTESFESPVDFPPALEDLVSGAEANLAKVETVCARAALRVERDEFDRAVDRDGKSFRTQTAEFALWQDGQWLRLDRAFDRTFDLLNNSIIYHLPMPDVAGTVRSEDAKGFVTKHGTPQETIRYLREGGREYIYWVESKHMYVRRPKAPYPIMAELRWLTTGPTVHDRTLRALVAEALRREMDVVLTEDRLGHRVLTISTVYTLPDGTTIPTSTRLLIDAKNGNTIRQVEVRTSGQVDHTIDYEYAEAGGAWVVVGGDDRVFDPASGRMTGRTTLHVDKSSLRINDVVDPKVFRADDLRIAKGAMVYDQFKGEKYLHEDVSIGEKIRMNRGAQP